MNTLSIYTDVDTLFDTRRGILEHILKKNGHCWDDYKDIYKDRKIDFFEYPELGIYHTAYLERFAMRDVDDWCDDTTCYFYPTNIIKEILPIVRSVEFGSLKTIMVAKITLHVNLYPFNMSEPLQLQLISHLSGAFKIPVDIKLISVDYDHQNANFIGNYNYVFRYGHLISPDFKAWFDTFSTCIKSGTKIIVPELLAKPVGDADELEPMRKESAKTIIEKVSALQGGKCIFIPLDKSLFDYAVN